MNVVIIEDEELAAMRLESMILKIDPTIEVLAKLESVEESVEWLNNNGDPDLIFLDINMPAMNGWEFLEAYKKINKQGHSVSLIMLTTSLNPEDVQKAREYSEVTDFKSKPLSEEMVRDILDRL